MEYADNGIITISDDIYDFTTKYVELTKRDLTFHAIRKSIGTVWADKTDPEQMSKEIENYKESDIIPGIRMKGDHTKGMYTLMSALQMEYFEIIKIHNASREGAEMIMQERRGQCYFNVSEFEEKLNSQFYKRLKIIDYRLFCKLLLFGRSNCELDVVIPTIYDYIIPGKNEQMMLGQMLNQYIDCAYRDIGTFEYMLNKIYKINEEDDVISDIKNKLENAKDSLELLRNGNIIRQQQIEDTMISNLKFELNNKIRNLHENDEFPVLLCKIFEKKGYYNIAMTPDTRDDGCDIWAIRNVKDGESNIINQILLISAKRYSINIDISVINDFKADVERYEKHVIPIIVTTSDYSRNAEKLMKKYDIEYININYIINFLIRHNLGVTRNYTIDNGFWQNLREEKNKYRNGPLSMYPKPKKSKKEYVS